MSRTRREIDHPAPAVMPTIPAALGKMRASSSVMMQLMKGSSLRASPR
jgi:hypothetical protein